MTPSRILCLQEVHGNYEQFAAGLHSHFEEYHIFHNIPIHSAGGIVTPVPKRLFSEYLCSAQVFADSRVHRIEILHPESQAKLVVWNVHVFDIGDGDMTNIEAAMLADYNFCALQGISNLCLVAGDFNYRVLGEARLFLQDPSRVAAPDALSALERRMATVLKNGFDLCHGGHTHFHSGSQSTSRIDRVHVLGPAWLCLHYFLAARVCGDPFVLFERRISDHAPLVVSVSSSQKSSHPCRTIPIEVVEHPTFELVLRNLCSLRTFTIAAPHEQLRLFNLFIQTASTFVRDRLKFDKTYSNFSQKLLLTTISRCIFRQDTQLALCFEAGALC
jgi:endonuclease/exonuclease/phosphatase family metal-dependent hydrolase